MANEITSKPAARKRAPRKAKIAPPAVPPLNAAEIKGLHHPLRKLVHGLSVPVLGQPRMAAAYAQLAADAKEIARLADHLAKART